MANQVANFAGNSHCWASQTVAPEVFTLHCQAS